MRELTEKPGRLTGRELFRRGFIAGLGWSLGATVGVVVISTVVVWILNILGGLPLVGNFIANIVEETQFQLLSR